MQFHEPFPIGTAATAVRERPAGNVPFGTRFALDVPEIDAGAEARAEAERSYLDPDRQISLVEVDGVEVPVMKRSNQQTTTTTNQQDRQAPDDDTDVGSNG